MNKLRYLSFDDLFLLKYLREGQTLTAAAKALSLTQPAITQRVRKMENVFGCKILSKAGRHVRLTVDGQNICTKAVGALTLMDELAGESSAVVVRIGTRPEAGLSWLWPTLATLRAKQPNVTYHMHFGSGEEILAQLGIGSLDAVLTSAPVTTRDFNALELVAEEYVFVAASKVAQDIAQVDDLTKYTLIEHDRSFPFLRYVAPKDKSKLRFGDVWFTGSTVAMTDALVKGLGVGIVPAYLARPYLKNGKLRELNVHLKIASDFFRLIYRTDRDIDGPMQILAKYLKTGGLR